MEQDSCIKIWPKIVEGHLAVAPNYRGPVVMLLEDEPIISMDIESTLSDAGFEVVNFMSCAEAHAWLKGRLPDFAIVDIELRDGPCSDVVARLTHADIPFVVHSGDNPSVHAGTPFEKGTWIGKPADSKCLIAAAWSSISAIG